MRVSCGSVSRRGLNLAGACCEIHPRPGVGGALRWAVFLWRPESWAAAEVASRGSSKVRRWLTRAAKEPHIPTARADGLAQTTELPPVGFAGRADAPRPSRK